MSTRFLSLAVAVAASGLLVAAAARGDDLLDDVKARAKIEAQRIEKEFNDHRAEAYRLVRRDDPRLLESTEKLVNLLEAIKSDTSLDSARRRQLIVTLKWDLDKVKEIAAERRKVAVRTEQRVINDTARRDVAKAGVDRRNEETRGTAGLAGSIIESRGKGLDSARNDRVNKNDRYSRVLGSVDKSAVPESRDYVLPKNWAELSRKRSVGVKMTAKEEAIMKALDRTIDVDFQKDNFDGVLESLRKTLKVEITTDKRGLTEAAVGEDTTVTLKMRASARTVLKRILGDLNLAYAIKDEAILITSQERAKDMTTTRTYYIGDLVSVVDIRLPPALTQAIMIDNVDRLIATIQGKVDPRSWRANNPEAPGSIVFDPARMTLIVKQTSEFHFMMSGR